METSNSLVAITVGEMGFSVLRNKTLLNSVCFDLYYFISFYHCFFPNLLVFLFFFSFLLMTQNWQLYSELLLRMLHDDNPVLLMAMNADRSANAPFSLLEGSRAFAVIPCH